MFYGRVSGFGGWWGGVEITNTKHPMIKEKRAFRFPLRGLNSRKWKGKLCRQKKSESKNVSWGVFRRKKDREYMIVP